MRSDRCSHKGWTHTSNIVWCAWCELAEKDDKIKRLNERTEELEKFVDELTNYPGRVVLTYDQIDATWRILLRCLPGTTEHAMVAFALAELGIERCEECGGIGKIHSVADHDNTVPVTDVCDICDSHGWVLEADDE
jgi:hypothetical protein